MHPTAWPADAEFIAKARTLVPALIGRVRELEAEARYLNRQYLDRGDQLVKLRMVLKAARKSGGAS
jgi:hypothetical protein